MAPRSATGTGRALDALMVALRKLPIPIIGRIEKDACVLDLRCLDDVPAFLSTLARLELGDGGTP
jgi:L-seryl-tRNA(Ser) seleniumtransferase